MPHLSRDLFVTCVYNGVFEDKLVYAKYFSIIAHVIVPYIVQKI
jgi:hypothetical protein